MKRLIWIGLLLAGWNAAALAHDIGVSPAWLQAQEDGSYVLAVRAGPALSHLFAAPQLPSGCEPVAGAWGVQTGERKLFQFACRDGLGPDDTLLLPWQRDGILLSVQWPDGSHSRRLFQTQSGRIEVPLESLQAPAGTSWKAAQRYFGLGIEHILFGADHLAFVLGLLLLVRGVGMLVKTITAFTVAHSLTLALATLGFLGLPPRPVEAAIALSILYLAVEVVRPRSDGTGIARRAPWRVAFAFGLLHGLGFAGALASIGLPTAEIPLALVFFNLGVEFGQLLFVFAVLGLGRIIMTRTEGLPAGARILPAYFIGGIAAYWLIDRTFSIVWQI